MESRQQESEHDQLNQIAKLQLKKFEADVWPFNDYAIKKQPTTPSEWFSENFPVQAKIYGCPFIELVKEEAGGLKKVNPLSANIDFLAAILGGDGRLGHKVVYFESEMEFYFYDPRVKFFKPVSQDKLGNLMRAYLIRCAEELPATVHKLNLFLEFRSDKIIRAIIHRAKSILAADHTFFGADSRNQRQNGAELHERVAKVFIEQVLDRQPGEVLTLTNAYLVFCEYLKHKSMPPLKRGMFKRLMAPLIRDFFDLGLRNDVIDRGSQKQTAGWLGLKAVELAGN